MARLKDYLKDPITITNPYSGGQISVKPNAAYEDNPYFYSRRFEVAKAIDEYQIMMMWQDTGTTNNYGFYYYPDLVTL